MIYNMIHLFRISACCGLLILLITGPLFGESGDQPGEHDSTAEDSLGSGDYLIGKNSVLKIDDSVLQTLSAHERDWYKRFQEGVLFFDGWSEISEEILGTFPEEQLPERQTMVQRLGIKIGTEWCKTNDERRIDTTMLKGWGKRLRSSIIVGPDSLAQTLQEIEHEVDMILKNDEGLSLLTPRS